jgi:tetratricopeptide (TPR) repeat protein
MEHAMRIASGCCGIVVTALLAMAPGAAVAAEYCATYRNGGSSCGFRSHGQCLAAISGVGGYCNVSPYPDAEPAERPGHRASAPSRTRSNAANRQPKQPARATAARPVPAVAAAPAAAAVAASAPTAQPNPAAFAAARKLILDGQYQPGLAAMQALQAGNNADVASYIGLAHRKLGRIAEATSWYGRALAADPNHKLALSFYGMMRAERGDLAGARATLRRIERLCGASKCDEYRALQGAIAGKTR